MSEPVTPTPCRLGYVEYDNTAYCFEHADFTRCDDPHGRCETARGLWRAFRVVVKASQS